MKIFIAKGENLTLDGIVESGSQIDLHQFHAVIAHFDFRYPDGLFEVVEGGYQLTYPKPVDPR